MLTIRMTDNVAAFLGLGVGVSTIDPTDGLTPQLGAKLNRGSHRPGHSSPEQSSERKRLINVRRRTCSRSLSQRNEPVCTPRELSGVVVHLIVDTSERSLCHHGERDFCDDYSE